MTDLTDLANKDSQVEEFSKKIHKWATKKATIGGDYTTQLQGGPPTSYK